VNATASPTAVRAKRKPPSVPQVLADQKKQTEAARALVPAAPASVPAVVTPTPAGDYLDEIAGGSPGRTIRFDGKVGKFITADDKKEVDAGRRFAARCDQCLVGWLKFNGAGQRPDRIQELWHAGYQLPAREGLGDLDRSKWPDGLNGEPANPWVHALALVLQETDEAAGMFCFETRSITGRKAVGTLLRHYQRMRHDGKEAFPIVSLRAGGYNSNRGFGWVPVPVFAIIGTTAAADQTKVASFGEELGDEIAY
jgi:hypothetical protein